MLHLKKIVRNIYEVIKDEFFFIIFLILLYIILTYPLNYYIIVGGGTSDVSSRIRVEDAYKSKGSFNISYVTELKGTIITYLLSYIMTTWERQSVNDYKYDDKESISDITFRSNLDLLTSNGTSIYWGYSLANQSVSIKSSDLYVITVFSGYETSLKIRDKIISMDDHHYDTIKEYRDYIQTKSVEDTVTIKIIRDKEEKEVIVPLYLYEDTLILGVGLQYVRQYDTNPDIKVQFKRSESGPSGGLISTLEIYNQLTKKDLTKGRKIAGTGTIEEDGSIGSIGGVKYKLLGAVSDKADIFLVPSGDNYQEAIKYQKSKKIKIKIIAVESIKDAIEKLEK